MPHVTIDTLVGKTQEEKQLLVNHVLKGFEAIGIKPGGVTMVIHDVTLGNYFVGSEDMNAYRARLQAGKDGTQT